MAAYDKRANRRPGAPRPVEGNLARKLDRRELDRRELDRSGRMEFDELYERRPESAMERNARRRANFKATLRTAQRVSPMAMLGFACVAALMVALLLCYVRLNSISRSIVSMKSETNQLKVEQVNLLTEYEQTFDLSAVKEAAEAAGMTQPSEGQIYYVSLPGEDQVTAHQVESGALERLFTALSRWIRR